MNCMYQVARSQSSKALEHRLRQVLNYREFPDEIPNLKKTNWNSKVFRLIKMANTARRDEDSSHQPLMNSMCLGPFKGKYPKNRRTWKDNDASRIWKDLDGRTCENRRLQYLLSSTAHYKRFHLNSSRNLVADATTQKFLFHHLIIPNALQNCKLLNHLRLQGVPIDEIIAEVH